MVGCRMVSVVADVAPVAEPSGGTRIGERTGDGGTGGTGPEEVMVRRRLEESLGGWHGLAVFPAQLSDGADMMELALLCSGHREVLCPLQSS